MDRGAADAPQRAHRDSSTGSHRSFYFGARRGQGVRELLRVLAAGLGHVVAPATAAADGRRGDLDHRAGLHAALDRAGRDGHEQRRAALAGCAEHELDNDRVLRALTLINQPQQPPGREFAYSNTGYVLLAEVLRRVTGTDLDVLARTVLFEPLGLTSARWGGPALTTTPGQPTPPAHASGPPPRSSAAPSWSGR